MTEMAPEQPVPLPLDGLEQGDPINIEAEGHYDADAKIFTMTWGLRGSVVLSIYYRADEEPIIPTMLQTALQSWEGIHDQIVAAIKSGQPDERKS